MAIIISPHLSDLNKRTEKFVNIPIRDCADISHWYLNNNHCMDFNVL